MRTHRGKNFHFPRLCHTETMPRKKRGDAPGAGSGDIRALFGAPALPNISHNASIARAPTAPAQQPVIVNRKRTQIEERSDAGDDDGEDLGYSGTLHCASAKRNLRRSP